jgi:hypothetical protein
MTAVSSPALRVRRWEHAADLRIVGTGFWLGLLVIPTTMEIDIYASHPDGRLAILSRGFPCPGFCGSKANPRPPHHRCGALHETMLTTTTISWVQTSGCMVCGCLHGEWVFEYPVQTCCASPEEEGPWWQQKPSSIPKRMVLENMSYSMYCVI